MKFKKFNVFDIHPEVVPEVIEELQSLNFTAYESNPKVLRQIGKLAKNIVRIRCLKETQKMYKIIFGGGYDERQR